MSSIDDRYPELETVLTRTNTIDAVRKLGRKGSRRAKQRAVALYLGALNDGVINKRTLERCLLRVGAFNQANFVQDMTKDTKHGLWTRVEHDRYGYRSGRGPFGWKLTNEGQLLAERVVLAVREGWNALQRTIRETMTISVSRIVCAFCGEDVSEEDKAECGECHTGVHATCWKDMRSHGRSQARCHVMGCGGTVSVKAIPSEYVYETDNVQRCYSCKGSGVRTKVSSANTDGCGDCAYGTQCREHPVVVATVDCDGCGGTGDTRNKGQVVETTTTEDTTTHSPSETPRMVIRVRRVSDVPVHDGTGEA